MIPRTITTQGQPIVPVTDYSCTRALGVAVHHYALGKHNLDDARSVRVRRKAGWSWDVPRGYVFVWGGL